MRPVQRGPAPRAFTDYRQARDPLVTAIGGYCSYCEMPCQFTVEHVLPWENKHTGLKLVWTNFLLTCVYCNNNKRSRQNSTPHTNEAAARARYYWPDRDNTARAFAYLPTNQITVASGLTAAQQVIANATRHMVGLEKLPPDPRAQKRGEAWKAAQIFFSDYDPHPSPQKRALICTAAKGYGFWSVWRAVFAAHPDVLIDLNTAFTGTDPASFDAAGQPQPRPGGQL